MEGSSADKLRKGGLQKLMKNIYVWNYKEWKTTEWEFMFCISHQFTHCTREGKR